MIPGAILGLIAQYLAGIGSDYVIKQMVKRNKGRYEPEYRLLLMIPQTIFSVVGIIGFGMSVARERPLWVVLFFYACVAFSAPFGSLASIGYLVDAMPTRNQEALVSTMLARSVMTIFFASYINGWLDHYGVESVFIAFGIFSTIISALTIPFYVYGKVLRTWISGWKLLKKLESTLA